ncbi:MAG: PD40 domain-containing protein [Chloroflexota bacterium]|jgi:WD40 repeat protein
MARRNVKVGDIKDVNGEITIAAGDISIYKGFTAKQVSDILKQITTTFQPKPFDGRCPYKGLEVFEEEDAELFFGRERLVDNLVNRVKESRTVFITGPSGSGKSSLVRAGLIHALRQGAIKGLQSERWLYEIIKPGRDPLEALAVAFSRLKSPELANYFREHVNKPDILHECAESILSERRNQRFVLFVDQFEEAFTQVGKEKAEAFINMLTNAATIENGRLVILFALRTDFVSNCATYPQLNDLLNRQFLQVGAMQPDELVSAIAQPALRVGLCIDPDLIAQIINDMEGEPGTLPLMQFALKDLFDAEQAKGRMIALTREAYLQRGGIHKSLERHADDAFSKLSENEQELARTIFAGLIEVGHGTPDTCRTALFDELIPAGAGLQDVETVVQKLASARLITTDEQAGRDTVTISHEKLIEAWPWLKKLVNENRDAIALQNEIAEDAREWETHGRDGSYLYTGARLINAHEQLEKRSLVLSGLAQEFVRKGILRKKRGQLIMIAGVLSFVLLLMFGVIVFGREASINEQLALRNEEIAHTAQAASTRAVAQEGTARANAAEAIKQAKIARAEELAAKAVSARDLNFPVSLLLGVEAYNTFDTFHTRKILFENIQSFPHIRQYLYVGGVLKTIAVSPDGMTLATGSCDVAFNCPQADIKLWRLEEISLTGESLPLQEGIFSLAFSPDSKTLATVHWSDVRLWDVSTRELITDPFPAHGSRGNVAFSSDGVSILTPGGLDHGPLIWDLDTYQIIHELPLYNSYNLNLVRFSPNGKKFATLTYDPLTSANTDNNGILIWDSFTYEVVTRLFGHEGITTALTFSPDGKILASGGKDGAVILWDADTYLPIHRPLSAHNGAVVSVAFSPDGNILASSSSDQTIILWDASSGTPVGQPIKAPTIASDLVFTPDGNSLISRGADNNVIFWDVIPQQQLTRILANDLPFILDLAFSPDGKTIASDHDDDVIRLWDIETGKLTGRINYTESICCLSFSPDGVILAAGSQDRIILWDAANLQQIRSPLKKHTSWIGDITFSADGKWLASSDQDGTVIVWDVATGESIGQISTNIAYGNSLFHLTFSPDSKKLAFVDGDQIIMLDITTQPFALEKFPEVYNFIDGLLFSLDGKVLISINANGDIISWDIATREPINTMLSMADAWGGNTGNDFAAFSLDAKFAISRDMTLWDVATRQPLGNLAKEEWFTNIVSSPEENLLASVGDDNGAIILWDINPHSWVELTCQRVGRNFTQDEWQEYFPNEEYRATCPQWPAGN